MSQIDGNLLDDTSYFQKETSLFWKFMFNETRNLRLYFFKSLHLSKQEI